MTAGSHRTLKLVRSAAIGAVLGILFLHPAASVISWLERDPRGTPSAESFWGFAGRRAITAFMPRMLPMTAAFAAIGCLLGLMGGVSYRGLVLRDRPERMREADLARDLGALLREGESDRVEFKGSARWDAKLGRTNAELEDAVVRTIAGFMNHRGGILLIGVADSGEVVGLEPDYRTLKHKDRDGFEQFLVARVKSQLGGDLCPLVQVSFVPAASKEVCRVQVEPSLHPVYCQHGTIARYFLRMGNSTRELDVREAMQHIDERWPARRHLTHRRVLDGTSG